MDLLVIEDDPAIRKLIRLNLEQQRVNVMDAGDGASGRNALRAKKYDVVILDLTLPDESGFEILRALRQTGSTTQVIVVSGATTEADRVQALLAGADDYVPKPFFPRELTARVLAASRRFHLNTGRIVRFGDLELNLTSRDVTLGGVPVDLTVKEFDLLAFLSTRPGHIFSREELLRAVWHSSSEWQRPSTVTEHLRRLRSKIDPDSSRRLFTTVRGIGYRFDPPVRTI